MGMQFYFNYAAEDKSAFEVAEVCGFFTDLIECSKELQMEWDLWEPFVAEYRAARPTHDDWCESPDYDPDEPLYSSEPPSEEEMEELLDLMEWGPSKPFHADELRYWGQKWSAIMDALDEEQATIVFAGNTRLQHKEGVFGRNALIEELKPVIEMAFCALRHEVAITMSMSMD